MDYNLELWIKSRSCAPLNCVRARVCVFASCHSNRSETKKIKSLELSFQKASMLTPALLIIKTLYAIVSTYIHVCSS